MAAAESETNHPLFRLFVVEARGCRLGIELELVQRLMLLMEIQAVPQGPDYLVGLMNYRGEAVPVVDLGQRLGLGEPEPYTLATPLLLTSSDDRQVALVVDEVHGVRQMPRSEIRGDAMFEGGLPPVRGVVALDEGGALILDMRRVLDIDLSGLQQPLSLDEELRGLCRSDA